MSTITFIFDNHIIKFQDTMQHKQFDEVYCYGVYFFCDNKTIQLIHNREVNWSRIIISNKNGEWNDIPFKPAAFSVLPLGVEVYDMYGELL